MDIVIQIFEQMFSLLIFLFLFTMVSKKKLTSRDLFLALSIDLTIYFSIALLMLYFNVQFLSYFLLPIVMVLLSFILLRRLNTAMIVFYGLFPVVLWNIFYRIILYFIIPKMGITIDSSSALLFSISDLIAAGISILFLKWLEFDFSQLQSENLYKNHQRIIQFTNLIMFSYFVLIQLLVYIQNEYGISTHSYRELLVIIQLITFMGIANKLDKRLKESLQEKLVLQQELQLHNMESYSKHIEDLYKEVRSFRHDYANILTTLKLGIENDDLKLIKEIYQSVLKDSNKHFRERKYDVARLINVKDSALKSLLAAKFARSTENHVSLSLEVPEEVETKGIKLIDFITIVSILCDNAIDAAVNTTRPEVKVAYLSVEEKQIFIVENTISEEFIDINHIYEYGESSKGEGRGIGLYNIAKIIDQYPNISIKTESYNYKFFQTLEIKI
ncbi:sensor histidine kinase [Streptococcus thoraltensis]